MAKWINHPTKGLTCSECGKEALYYVCGVPFARSFGQSKSDYCPHCGEPMRPMCEKCEHFSTCDRKNPFCGASVDSSSE